MRALVVYESMFGNTRSLAEVVTHALAENMTARMFRADVVTDDDVRDADLLVVGSPTHAWSLPRPDTRKGALNNMLQPGSDLVLEPGADAAPGVREWLASLGELTVLGAAFDTRFHAPVVFTGRAANRIAKELSRHGVALAVPTESFLVDRKNRLLAGELDRASSWGRRLGEVAVAQRTVGP